MAKIESAMLNMAAILDGLTGGLDLDVLDTGYGLRDGHAVSYAPKARRFGAVLPANSPGVHALWLPAFALKMPLALKPGHANRGRRCGSWNRSARPDSRRRLLASIRRDTTGRASSCESAARR